MSFFFIAQASGEQQVRCRQRAETALHSINLPACCGLTREEGLLMAGAPHEGVLQTHSSEKETAFLLGYALDEEGAPLTPERLARRWGREPAFQPDGYFVAAVFRADGSISVAVDPLGIYPCLYSQVPDGGWVVASAAKDLCCHPDFKAKSDVEGIAGQLLINNPFDNRCTVDGVRLIPPRSVLHLRKGEDPIMMQADLPSFSVSGTEEDIQEEFARRWHQTFRKHSAVSKKDSADLLLSGGRDSRMMAASAGIEHRRLRPVTFGLPHEYEVKASRAVSKQLKMKGGLILRDDRSDWWMEGWNARSLRAAGLGGGTFGGLHPYSDFSPWLFHGFLLDDFVSGFATAFSWDPDVNRHRGGFFFEKLNRWGFPPEALRDLFRDREAGELGVDLRDRMLSDFEQRQDEGGQASFDWKLKTRCRYHLGITLWELTRTTWPVVPVCDQNLYAFMRALPLRYVEKRKLQNAWMESHAPKLLRIPYDNNTHLFAPEHSSWRWPAWRRRMLDSPQPLRYHRVFSMQHPGWPEIVGEAEKAREALYGIFDPDALDRLWPKDLLAHSYSNPFSSLAGVRSLMVLAGFFAQEDL